MDEERMHRRVCREASEMARSSAFDVSSTETILVSNALSKVYLPFVSWHREDLKVFHVERDIESISSSSHCFSTGKIGGSHRTTTHD